MSASLVGSEMCIRDSYLYAVWRPRVPGRGRLQAPSEDLILWEEGGGSCNSGVTHKVRLQPQSGNCPELHLGG
eukprot:10973484-Alexandrium_andersonii.AAC.1